MPFNNQLSKETSQYLLQYDDNPVAWQPWNDSSLLLAKETNRPILLSIGYSSCHWCHVMAEESFQDPDIAQTMNEHFICIKVDREELPNVDQLYMNALHAMGVQGGWPMNVFLMPNQKPFYGVTYLPPIQWKKLLLEIANAYEKHHSQLEESADGFTQALQHFVPQRSHQQHILSLPTIGLFMDTLYAEQDHAYGGMQGAPKFPMPSIMQFFFQYYLLTKDQRALSQMQVTLDHMAHGGIYDQLSGGFGRYATDVTWHIPHFEKMLSDNGQLLSSYAQGYWITQNRGYQQVIKETVHFLAQHMQDKNGGFYTSIDASTHGDEGSFYCWNLDEVKDTLQSDAPLVIDYFNLTAEGNWENGKNILYRSQEESALLEKHGISSKELEEKLQAAKQSLLRRRNLRAQPSIDPKIITSWNAMTMAGLIDAFRATGDESCFNMAQQNGDFLLDHMINHGKVWHTFQQGEAKIQGYLDDYAWIIKAFISFYQISLQEKWIVVAKELCERTLENFLDEQDGYFQYSDPSSTALIATQKEYLDHVVPSGNAMMTENLYQLSLIFHQSEYREQADRMLKNITPLFEEESGYLGYWASVYCQQLESQKTIAIIGPQAEEWAKRLQRKWLPNTVIVGSERSSQIPLLKDKKPINGQTTAFVCKEQVCLPPITSLEAVHQLVI